MFKNQTVDLKTEDYSIARAEADKHIRLLKNKYSDVEELSFARAWGGGFKMNLLITDTR